MKQLSLGFIAFLQATGILLYCGLISNILLMGEKWIGPRPGFLGPALFMSLFATSAVVCTLIFLTYPFLLFWEHKQTAKALRLVLYSTLWLAGFVISGLLLFALT